MGLTWACPNIILFYNKLSAKGNCMSQLQKIACTMEEVVGQPKQLLWLTVG